MFRPQPWRLPMNELNRYDTIEPFRVKYQDEPPGFCLPPTPFWQSFEGVGVWGCWIVLGIVFIGALVIAMGG